MNSCCSAFNSFFTDTGRSVKEYVSYEVTFNSFFTDTIHNLLTDKKSNRSFNSFFTDTRCSGCIA